MRYRSELPEIPMHGFRRLILILAAGLVGFSASRIPLEGAVGPIRVSENGRYFVDDQGKPFYLLADTQWELFRRYSLDEAKVILENRKAKGFTVLMVMLTGVGPGTEPNLAGERPWIKLGGASSDRIVTQVEQCPSGALSWERV